MTQKFTFCPTTLACLSSLEVEVLVTQSCPTLVTPCIVAHQAPLSMEFSVITPWLAQAFQGCYSMSSSSFQCHQENSIFLPVGYNIWLSIHVPQKYYFLFRHYHNLWTEEPGRLYGPQGRKESDRTWQLNTITKLCYIAHN